ncbi:hypothetical protein [Clostridium septicum]|uniref:Uncharacterized protein n=1 Tax=Clostridium septicum TaxID=1504 RepID=A0A9N7JN16_CLOSE|nr:hypothetical protein [Clostridium septicum]AYE35633.1 hypothetical protein CP523_14995 [Clostridium septicum]MDU1313230.1 hypothetical protein [Clostridium septicum]QAS61020.1 hypothetical protein EI377_09950 [Clostridium septicum]UEC19702.1 hypothetical protein LK444_09740 [Clostridium septicum]USS02237.1 hypothetical protein NH397_07435 [Clostridium septicum]
MKKRFYLTNIIVLITIMQVGYLWVHTFKAQEEDIEVFKEVKEVKSIKEIESNLERLKNYSIEEYFKEKDGWIITLKLSGIENILYNLNNLNKFYIKNYDFYYENYNAMLNLTLKSK